MVRRSVLPVTSQPYLPSLSRARPMAMGGEEDPCQAPPARLGWGRRERRQARAGDVQPHVRGVLVAVTGALEGAKGDVVRGHGGGGVDVAGELDHAPGFEPREPVAHEDRRLAAAQDDLLLPDVGAIAALDQQRDLQRAAVAEADLGVAKGAHGRAVALDAVRPGVAVVVDHLAHVPAAGADEFAARCLVDARDDVAGDGVETDMEKVILQFGADIAHGYT